MHIGNHLSHFSPCSHSDAGRHVGQSQHALGFGGAPQQCDQMPGPRFGHSTTDSFTPGGPAQGKPQPQPLGPGAQGDGVPWISQMDPKGEDKSYKNADQNCGPAVMAMLAREHGKGQGTDDADLISKLGQVGGTDGTGTTGNGLIAMGQELGLNATPNKGADSQWVMGQLAQGKDVVANGDYNKLPNHSDPTKPQETSPHYILLTGIDKSGNITVEDPMDPNLRSLTPAQLDAYNNGQAEGGFNVAFS